MELGLMVHRLFLYRDRDARPMIGLQLSYNILLFRRPSHSIQTDETH